ncbi:MAG: 3'-5' exonuclease [Muribaculaceae bacterium]|nr:3'-5' exonuclease [Muribaculaceae bacterium]
MNVDDILVLDAEFVDNQEIIELAVTNIEGEILFHEFFKPQRINTWPNTIGKHRISPEDVKDKPSFASRIKDIKKIFDTARFIIGFATSNDISHLKKSGLKISSSTSIIDVKDYFWLEYKDILQKDYDSFPGLEFSAKYFGLEFEGKGAHSALSDTIVTLKLLEIFQKRILQREEIMNYDELSSVDRFLRSKKYFYKRFNSDYEAYRREKSKGYILVYKMEDGNYKLKFQHKKPEKQTDTLVLEVPVKDYHKAKRELGNRFSRYGVSFLKSIYSLKERDLRFIKKYKNEFEPNVSSSMSDMLLQLSNRFKA